MSDAVKFFCLLKEEIQLDFDGREHVKLVLCGEVHIVYSEILMCRQSRDRLKNDFKAKKHKVLSVRPKGRLCEKCEKKYREHPDLAFVKWINPPELKSNKTIPINPQLLEMK